jgi:hypothetical protein
MNNYAIYYRNTDWMEHHKFKPVYAIGGSDIR